MIIDYELLEKIILSLFKYATKDLEFDTFHLTYRDRFTVMGHGRYKTMKFKIQGSFQLELNQDLLIKDIQGTLYLAFIKLDLCSFLKEMLHHERLQWCDDQLCFSLEPYLLPLKIQEITPTYLHLNL